MQRRHGASARTRGGGLAADMLKGALAGAIGIWAMDRVDHFPSGRRRDAYLPRQARPAGVLAHYGPGVLPGALYGALRGRVTGLGAGRALLYGAGLFILRNQILKSAAAAPAASAHRPWRAQARGLASSLAGGLATDMALDFLDGFDQAGRVRQRRATRPTTATRAVVATTTVWEVAERRPVAADERLAAWDQVDEASDDSFPASDPPSYVSNGRLGGPRRREPDAAKPIQAGGPQ